MLRFGVAAYLGGNGASLHGACARLTKLFFSSSANQVVAGGHPQPSGVEGASGAEIHGNLRELSDSAGDSISRKSQGGKFSLPFTPSSCEVEQNLSSIGCARVDGPEKVLKAFRAIDKTLNVTARSYIYQYLIQEFCRLGQLSQAVELVEEMYIQKMLLYPSIFIPILKSLSRELLLDEAFEAVAAMRRMKIQPNMKHYNILMQTCAATGNMEKAYAVLAELHQYGKHPGVVSFNHIISGFCKQRRFKRAKSVLQEMERFGMKPNTYTYSLLLRTAYTMRDFNAAMQLINEMKDCGLETDKVSTPVMLSFRADSGDLDNALKVVNKMTRNGQNSDPSLKSEVLRRLALAGRLDEAYEVYQEIKVGAKSQTQGSLVTLLAAYGTAGQLDRMLDIFEESIICQHLVCKSPEMYQPNYLLVSCIHIMLAFLHHNQLGRSAKFLRNITELGITDVGVLVDKVFLHIASSGVDVNDGLALLKEMRVLDVRPNRIALEALLDCCISTGNVEKALEVVQEMEKECLPLNIFSKIRLFGIFVAAGKQTEARRVLDEMSSDDLRDEAVKFLILRMLEVFSGDRDGPRVNGSLLKEVQKWLLV